MNDEVLIRGAREEDLPDITRIYNNAILNTTATFDTEPKTIEDRAEWFSEHTDEFPLIVAAIGGRVVGWGSIGPYGERKAYRYTVENAVYVDCDYRGRGLGRLLLGELVKLASERGYHAMIALVVGGNEASARLHAGFGFELIGTMREVGWKFDRWLDILVYERIL